MKTLECALCGEVLVKEDGPPYSFVAQASEFTIGCHNCGMTGTIGKGIVVKIDGVEENKDEEMYGLKDAEDPEVQFMKFSEMPDRFFSFHIDGFKGDEVLNAWDVSEAILTALYNLYKKSHLFSHPCLCYYPERNNYSLKVAIKEKKD